MNMILVDIGLLVLLILVMSIGAFGAVMYVKDEIIGKKSDECKSDGEESATPLKITTDKIDPSKITVAKLSYSEKDEKLYPADEYMKAYFEAKEEKDAKKMMAALIAKKEHCGQANSYCLNELFCPECPFGALHVRSGRAGM